MLLKFRTYAEAWAVNERVTADCIRNNQWTDGITTNYATPTQNENGQWEIPILLGYEQYFTLAEISRAQSPDWIEVTLWQFKQACAETVSPIPGFENLEKLIDYLFANMPDGLEKQRALRAWTSANHIRRDSISIEGFRLKVNEIAEREVLTKEAVDDVFIKADQIDA